jgi:geranylgeranyl pyrophosphate synthase
LNIFNSFQSLVSDEIVAVENLMRQQAEGFNEDLKAALDHLILSGGKRLRPNITLLVGKMLKGDIERIITLSAAIELLHTATLVHDDLIDGSLLRRGIPTLNSKWTPAATVLTGDFIFAKAAKLAAETNSIPVMKLFANTLGTIVNGEITQMFSSHCVSDLDIYYKRIYSKTASLFETSTTSAAIISEAGNTNKEYLRQFGYEMGIAFQIIDDILDFTSNQENLGKPVGGDLRLGIITLPAIIYLEENSDSFLAKEFFKYNCNPPMEVLEQLIQNIRKSDAIKRSLDKANSHINFCLKALNQFPASVERDALEELACFITQRNI